MQSKNPRDVAQRFITELLNHLPTLLLSGAGLSAGTGIPTYRDEKGTWLRSDPITHQEFVQQARQRQRYWGRSLLGWPGVREASPSAAHHAIAILEQNGHLAHTVTQNVDRLHQRAGSQQVTDLHGRLDRVTCLNCHVFTSRDAMQEELLAANPHITGNSNLRPDGDADLAESVVDSVSVPACGACGGVLMPDVVFFGGSIPKERIHASQAALEQSRSLLVVGSSLQVYSGYRFCRWANAQNKPVLLLNPGETRADALGVKWRTDADTGLAQILRALASTVPDPA